MKQITVLNMLCVCKNVICYFTRIDVVVIMRLDRFKDFKILWFFNEVDVTLPVQLVVLL